MYQKDPAALKFLTIAILPINKKIRKTNMNIHKHYKINKDVLTGNH